MLRSILIGIDNSASGIAAQELGLRWAKEFDARLTAITIVDGHGDELSAELVSAGASHNSVGPRPICEQPPTGWTPATGTSSKLFGQRCREAGVAFELIGDVGSPHVQILVEAQNHDIVLLGQRSRFEFGRKQRSRPDGQKNHPGLSAAGGCRARGVQRAASRSSSRMTAVFRLRAPSGRSRRRGWGVERRSTSSPSARPPGRDPVRRAARSSFLASHGIEATPQIVVTSLLAGRGRSSRKYESLDAGLLVMGAYGQSVLREFFLGSVTRTILTRSAEYRSFASIERAVPPLWHGTPPLSALERRIVGVCGLILVSTIGVKR